MTRLHVFDMDGTLLRGSTASLEVARLCGNGPDIVALETEFAAGAMTTREFAARLGTLWRGLSAEQVADAVRTAPWIAGIAEVTDDIRARGEHCAVITMSPDFFANHLLGYGFHVVHGSRFPALPLHTAPDPAHILEPADKIRLTTGLLARYGLGIDQCIAYGDSGSDLPLFRHLRWTVGINATPALREHAWMLHDGDDLRIAYHQARRAMTA